MLNARSLAYSVLVILCLLLAACGFQLRGASTGYQPTFSRLYLQTQNNPLAPVLRTALQVQGVSLTRQVDVAQAHVLLEPEVTERLVLSRSPQGRINEYQLRYSVAFSVIPLHQAPLIDKQRIALHRDYNYASAQILSQESEEQVLFEEMRHDAAEQILRQIEALSQQPMQSVAP